MILVLAITGFSQTFEPTPLDELSKLDLTPTCSIPVERSPSIRGLKLEITISHAQKAFPKDSGISLIPGDNPLTVSRLMKIKAFSDIRDGFIYTSESRKPARVSFISFSYIDRNWGSLEEFAKHVTDSMDLPYKSLVFKDNAATMQCKDWSLILGVNSVTLFSSHLMKDRADSRELKKAAFVP